LVAGKPGVGPGGEKVRVVGGKKVTWGIFFFLEFFFSPLPPPPPGQYHYSSA